MKFSGFDVVKLLPNGTANSAFGNNGRASVPDLPYGSLDMDTFGHAIGTQPDGDVVVGGSIDNGAEDEDFVVFGFTPDGQLDSSFGVNGMSRIYTGPGNDVLEALFVQPDGKMLLGGYNSKSFSVVRLNPDGSIDSTFGNSGFSANFGTVYDFAPAPGNKMLAATYGRPIRFNLDGVRDTLFAAPYIDFGYTIYGRSIALQQDGKVLISAENNQDDFLVARYMGGENTAPVVTPMSPLPGATTTDKTPNISARVKDNETDLLKRAITLTVDGVVIPRASFTYDTALNKMVYTPVDRMALGTHRVRVDAKDELGVITTKRWTFDIVAP
jgi:uncharacterized delta-60 repeat protein